MNINTINRNSITNDYLFPKWKWFGKWWLSIIPFLLSLIIFFAPGLIEDRFQKFRYILGVCLLVSPIIFSTIIWLYKTLDIIIKRIGNYRYLFEYSKRKNAELNNTRKTLFELIWNNFNKYAFEIKGARFYRNKIFIIIKKRNSPKLEKNDILMVAHIIDNVPMGTFKITENRTDEYYAIGLKDVDPIWSSFVRQKGEVHFMPYMLAIYLPKGEN